MRLIPIAAVVALLAAEPLRAQDAPANPDAAPPAGQPGPAANPDPAGGGPARDSNNVVKPVPVADPRAAIPAMTG